MSVITFDDVRQFLWDRTGADNQLTGALVFTDDDIRAAMRFAAREYNALPPISIQVNWNSLSGNTNMFLDAITVGLYIARMSQMQRNQIDYNAGGTTVNLEKAQIAYMTQRLPEHDKRFKEAAITQKTSCNLTGFFGLYDPAHMGAEGGHYGW